ncbi:hypothetical protein [Kitasatospora sp. NPDC047058]|uniref:DUF6919 domain-containing protein n=1 Tax=Kitasatospora sp. NPDC047058 TaxID=3155620 RepID=UPI0033C2F5B7
MTALQPWDRARTAADLGALTAQWLRGRIASRPGYQPGWGPSEETTTSPRLMAALLLANGAGFVTTASQPGFAGLLRESHLWSQRPAVTGWVTDEAVLERLCAAANAHALLLSVYHPAGPSLRHDGIPVTTRDSRPVTWFGRPHDPSREWNGAGEAAVRQMRGAWQVTLVDPDAEDRPLLWDALTGALSTNPVGDRHEAGLLTARQVTR